jgi:hypothetical protein
MKNKITYQDIIDSGHSEEEAKAIGEALAKAANAVNTVECLLINSKFEKLMRIDKTEVTIWAQLYHLKNIFLND